MKAVRAHSFGTPDVLVLEDVTTPQAGPGQLLIKVESASVNFSDVMRRGDVYPFPTGLPYTPGGEVAGTVEALGDGVEGPPVGTPVFAVVGGDGSSGYAQYAVASAQGVIPIPKGLSADEAAALIIAGSTAVLTLTDVGQLRSGETVLIQGAGGGVGGYAVQIAKILGATVIGASSTPAGRETALALGADHAVDYTDPAWTATIADLTGGRGVDVVLEISGGDTLAQSLTVLAPFGRVVVAGRASGRALQLDDAAIQHLFYDPALNQSLRTFNLGIYFGLKPEIAIQAMQTLIGYAASGQAKVQIGRTMALADAAEAHRLVEDRQNTGKIILKPWTTS